MSFYEVGIATVAPLTVANYMSMIATAAVRPRIREMGMFCNAATASSIGIGHPGNTATPLSPTVGQPVDVNDQTSLASVSTTWTTAPTVPAQFFRRIVLPATIGAGIVWVWNPGEELALEKVTTANGQLTWWNFGGATASVLQGYVKWNE